MTIENTHPTGTLPTVVVPAIHDRPLGERVAADLSTLASIATSDPALAAELARAIEHLCVVLPARQGPAPVHHGDFDLALTDRGATRVDPKHVEPKWATQAWTLPAGVVRVTVTQLSIPLDELTL